MTLERHLYPVLSFFHPKHYKPRTNIQLIATLEIAMFKVQLIISQKMNKVIASPSPSFFFFFFAAPVTYRSSQAKDKTQARAVTQATAVVATS